MTAQRYQLKDTKNTIFFLLMSTEISLAGVKFNLGVGNFLPCMKVAIYQNQTKEDIQFTE